MSHPAIFNLGFRVFFCGASLFAVISIAIWLLIFSGLHTSEWDGLYFSLPSFSQLSPFQWHAHEMIFGYSLAVISGFLLTAVKNWTGIQTIHGYPLAGLFFLWLLARLCWLTGDELLVLAGIFDLCFILGLGFAVSIPIIKTKQWRQMAILSKLILLGLANLAFYIGTYREATSPIHIGLYGGLYLIIGLILTIGRRIIPLFVQNALSYDANLFNAKWLDISSMLGLVGFLITDVFLGQIQLATFFAAWMFIITSIRIIGWYTPGIWSNPLLWCFYITLFFIDFGFLLYILAQFFSISPFLSVHAFAFGGIGVITLGMMARVSTGHTGRSLKNLPMSLLIALILISMGAAIRVLLPLFFPEYYPSWVIISGILWVSAFAIFCKTFLPYWTNPRIDNKYG